MKILKYGEGYPKTATCGNCQSELKYEPDDIKTYITDHRANSSGKRMQRQQETYIVCPVCKNHINLETIILYEYEQLFPFI